MIGFANKRDLPGHPNNKTQAECLPSVVFCSQNLFLSANMTETNFTIISFLITQNKN